MSRSPLDMLDDVLGGGMERLNQAVHHHRLRRHGQLAAMEPRGDRPWARTAGRPPRDGNDVEVLVDGGTALPRMAEALQGATRTVHIAGWHLEPDIHLTREPGSPTLRALLAGLADRGVVVRVLLWAGPPLPVFPPHRADVRRARDRLVDGTGVRCALDSREYTLHCHHEKLVLVDDRVAFVGGIDLTTLQGDRYDEPGHPARAGIGWHDAAARVTGPAVTDVAHHFRERWQEIVGEHLPEPAAQQPTGHHRVHLVRTLPNHTYAFAPHGEFSILESYLRALRTAERFIYLENQFLWSTEICGILDEKLRHPPCDEFRVVVLLPVNPSTGKDTSRGQLGGLINADRGDRLMATTVRSGVGEASGDCYEHAKVGIVDDRWMTIGSANLNEHSLFNDTEVNLVCDDPDLVRDTRLRLWGEHLELPAAEVTDPPHRVVDELWRPIASEQLRLLQHGEPSTRRLLAIPGLSRRAGRLAGPLRGLLVDG
ncbi:MAG: phospholipase D-like domain-containing protein [Marmoricola sp.]